MGWSTVFKYWGLAMEAAEQAAQVMSKMSVATDPNSPGGSEITHEEKLQLATTLDENFSTVITRICQESGLEVKSVKVEIEI